MSSSYIRSVTTQLPSHCYDNEQTVEAMKLWLSDQGENFCRKALKIVEKSKVELRHTIVPREILFSERSLEEKSKLYKQHAIEMGSQLLLKALDKSGIAPQELDYLITISCTGYMIPSLDAYLINELNLRPDVGRLPVTEMGCVAGVSGLIYAQQILKGDPTKKIALLCVEFPSNTIQLDNYSWDNIVGTALFTDGASCTILTGEKGPRDLTIIDSQMVQIPDSTNILGYSLVDSGFSMNLDSALPNVIAENFENILFPFLEKNNISMEQIDHFLVHPGGVKILNVIDKLLEKYRKHVLESSAIMKRLGNKSSATIGFIMEEFMKDSGPANQNIMVIGYGPGFVANLVLMKWERNEK